MNSDRVENQRKWGVALVVTIVLLIGSLVMTVATIYIAEWLPLYFCWGDILFLSAIIIIVLGFATGGTFPSTERWWEGASWGLLMAITAFALFASLPSRYSDYADQMRNLACFGTMMALFAFGIGATMRRYSVLLIAGSSFYVWIFLFQNEITALIFTVASLGAAAVFLYWLSKAYPIVKEETDYPDPAAIFSDPEFIKAVMAGKTQVKLSDDPDLAMAQLERMAQTESPVIANEDETPEWLMDYDTQQTEIQPMDPFHNDTFQEDNLLDKSSPAFLWIFVLLLIFILFMLTFLAVFIR